MSHTRCIVLLFALSITRAMAQTNCCDNLTCKDAVDDYVKRTKMLLGGFITYPLRSTDRDRYLDSLERNDPAYITKAVALIREARSKAEEERTWLACFTRRMFLVNVTPADTNIVEWHSYLSLKYTDFPFNSPEFRKGSGIHVDVNQGAVDLGDNLEGYAFMTRLLYSYTFRKDKTHNTGGRWRAMAGVSAYYHYRDWYILFNPRVEFRLKDIGNEQISIGNIKLIADGNFGDQVIAGGGVGLEIYNFGAQLLAHSVQDLNDYLITLGLFYRFQFQ